MAASRGRSGDGRTSRVTVRSRSRCLISVGPEVTATRASELTGMMSPERVTTGRLPMPWVSVISLC